MNHVNEILSEKMRVEPLKPGETATFRLSNFGQIDPLSNKEVYKAGRSLLGTHTIFDPDDGGGTLKTISNITGTDRITVTDGKGNKTVEIKPRVERVRFNSNASITLDHKKNDTYCYLMRHNGNATNPFRDKTHPVVFYLEQPDKAIAENIKKDDLTIRAKLLISRLSHGEIVTMATSINKEYGKVRISLSQDTSNISYQLRKLAESNPEVVINNSNNVSLQMYTLLKEAVSAGLIEFSQMDNKWYRIDGVNEKNEILYVEPGKDRFDELAEYLTVNNPQTNKIKKFLREGLKEPMTV